MNFFIFHKLFGDSSILDAGLVRRHHVFDVNKCIFSPIPLQNLQGFFNDARYILSPIHGLADVCWKQNLT